MILRDYNGSGRWSADQIIARYQTYTKRFKVSPRSVEPNATESGDTRWIYPVMERVIVGIEEGDVACAQIGVEFIEEDQSFPFGAILKSNTARALRRFPGLTKEQVRRIRARVVGMLTGGRVPREYREYSRLLRKVGVGDYGSAIAAASPRNRYAERALAYYQRHVLPRRD
ncbi:MAG: hypothetical protein ACI80K_002487 [Paracoccaceae bacterium]|jgi:hypothetical protein